MIVKTGNVGPSIKITDGSVGRRGEREIGKGSVLIMGGALMNSWEWGGVNENKRGKGSGEAAVENRCSFLALFIESTFTSLHYA